MATQIKITQLTDIGSANLSVTTLLPVVNMAGVPTTQKTTLGNLANVILSQSGGNYAAVGTANIAYSVANAAQPNITSVGTLTNVAVSGNATVNGNITSNGTAYVGNLSTTGLASITTLTVGATANLGAVANVTITGGSNGQVLTTNGSNVLSWTTVSSGNSSYGDSNVVTLLSAFGSNTITTTGNISGGNVLTSAQVIANGVIDSGTGLTTGGYLSVDGNTDLHNTVVTGNLSATGNITANNLGNISAINLTGSNSNVLYGNGVFAPIAGGNGTYGNSDVATFLAAYGSNTITTTGNVSVGNLSTNGIVKIGNATITEINPIVLGFTDDIYVDGDVLSQRLKSNTGTVALNASNSTADTQWTFNVNGTLTLPQPPASSNASTSIQSIYSNTSSFVDFVSNNSANFTFGTGANNNIVLIAGLNENDNRWVLGYDGNLTLAGGNSVIQSIANSSLDPTLPNVSTMTLTPDQNYNSQALVLDPTSPGHIHLRAYAFSNIDEPAANIFLGGEGTAFEVTSGPNNEVRVHSGGNTWTFGNDGKLTFPGTPRIDTSTNNFEVQAAEAINFEANTVVNIYTDAGNNAYQWQFGDDGNLTLPDTTGVLANVSITLEANDTGNITGLSLIGDSNANLYAHGNVTIVSDSSNTTATWSFVNTGDIVLPNDVVIGDDGSNGMMLSVPTVTPGTYSDWTFDQSGNLTLPTGGQIIVSGGLVSSGASPAPTINGFSITNSVGISGNGNIAGNNISATGNISANNFTGNGGTLSNVATKVEGSWTLATGVNTVNISVPLNGTYALWVNGNIPNGIVTYTATAVVTNTNVPVLGEQYAWYYAVGNALVFTSIPDQFVGTVGSISNVNTYAGNTANVFTFGITNNSGNTAVVNYGYTKL